MPKAKLYIHRPNYVDIAKEICQVDANECRVVVPSGFYKANQKDTADAKSLMRKLVGHRP